MIRTLTRVAVGGTLTAAEWPLRRVAGIFPAGELVVDQVDAALRDVAGTILFDQQLHEDARRRREAAAQRLTGVNLRDRAEEERIEAEERVEREREEAERLRAEARREADRKRRQARAETQAEKQQVEESARRRKQEARADARATHEVLDAVERDQRLAVLDKQSEALEEQREAVTANDEAQRLAEAAARAKAACKRG